RPAAGLLPQRPPRGRPRLAAGGGGGGGGRGGRALARGRRPGAPAAPPERGALGRRRQPGAGARGARPAHGARGGVRARRGRDARGPVGPAGRGAPLPPVLRRPGPAAAPGQGRGPHRGPGEGPAGGAPGAAERGAGGAARAARGGRGGVVRGVVPGTQRAAGAHDAGGVHGLRHLPRAGERRGRGGGRRPASAARRPPRGAREVLRPQQHREARGVARRARLLRHATAARPGGTYRGNREGAGRRLAGRDRPPRGGTPAGRAARSRGAEREGARVNPMNDGGAPAPLLVTIRPTAEVTIKAPRTRDTFLRKLRLAVQDALQRAGFVTRVRVQANRVLAEVQPKAGEDAGLEEARAALARVFGVGSFSFLEATARPELDDIVAVGTELFAERVKGRRYAVRCKRNGRHAFSSMDVERELGAALNP